DNFVPVMIDTDKDSATSRKFGVSAMPTIAIVDPKTETSEKTRGYQGSSQFLSFLSTNKPEIQVASQTEKPGKAQVGHADLVQQADKGEFTPYCLVTAVNEGKLVEGKKEFTSEHDGYTLHFASAETKKEFDSKPEDFWPALNGNCPVHLVETGELVRGEVRWVVEFRNKLYMCHSREHANKFIDSPSRYAAAAQDRVSSAR
ncbi:MAG: hypothetical protein KDA78_08465, partial [Planctomycetaceae bacterium]|nr:hypothetical protein [Planctomycetaceae bacterium]